MVNKVLNRKGTIIDALAFAVAFVLVTWALGALIGMLGFDILSKVYAWGFGQLTVGLLVVVMITFPVYKWLKKTLKIGA